MRISSTATRIRSWSTSPWCRSAVLVIPILCLAFSGRQTPPTWHVALPDVAVGSASDLAQSGANGDPFILQAFDEVYPGSTGPVVKRLSSHEMSRMTGPGKHGHSPDNCGHCYDMDGDHFAQSIGKRKNYGPGHEEGAPTGWHMHRALPGNCGIHQHATPCEPRLAAHETIEQVIDALGQGDTETLALLVTNARVQLVQIRSAIQVIGCDDRTIVAHIPMRSDFFSALAQLVAQQ